MPTPKILYISIVTFNLLALFYLVSPIPALPDLNFSAKSDEPGDTIQIPNVSGYYTNLTRSEVINFYQANYNGLFRINLNHPPEKAKQIIRDTIQSYYFEEFVLPFKESLYVNGFEWRNDVFTKPENRVKNKLIFQNQEYLSKVTIRRFPVPTPIRLLVFLITEISVFIVLKIYRRLLTHES